MKKYMQMRADLEVLLLVYSLKFIYSEKATKFLRNLPLTFDYSTRAAGTYFNMVRTVVLWWA